MPVACVETVDVVAAVSFAAEMPFDSVVLTSCKQVEVNLYPGIAFELQWLMHDAGTDKSC